MTTAKLPKLLTSLRTLLIWLLKIGPFNRTLSRVIGRLSAICQSLPVFLGCRGRRPPSASQDEDPASANTKIKSNDVVGPHATPGERAGFLHTPLPFTVEPSGEIVSLDNVAYSVSLYPNSGLIHDANRSAQSLHASIRSHRAAVDRSRSRETFASNNRSPSPSPTRSSFHSQGQGLHSYPSSIMGGSPASSTFGVDTQPRPSPPSVQDQESIAMPPLSEHIRLPIRTLSQPPDIDIISPFGTRIVIPNASSPVTPASFNQRLITPVMPEATQRYTRRPRM